jgi:hypothetical protein
MLDWSQMDQLWFGLVGCRLRPKSLSRADLLEKETDMDLLTAQARDLRLVVRVLARRLKHPDRVGANETPNELLAQKAVEFLHRDKSGTTPGG